MTNVIKLIGPGLLVAAAGIGAGDIVSSTMAASAHGLQLLWVVALAAFLKSFLNEGIARWQLATGTTAIEGWTLHLPWWVRTYFAFYLVIWTISVSAALTSASGLGIATHGAHRCATVGIAGRRRSSFRKWSVPEHAPISPPAGFATPWTRSTTRSTTCRLGIGC